MYTMLYLAVSHISIKHKHTRIHTHTHAKHHFEIHLISCCVTLALCTCVYSVGEISRLSLFLSVSERQRCSPEAKNTL